jgi:microcystin-dependent protein
MPGSTPTLALPYPTPDDQVDVPRDVKALADAIDPLGVVPVGCMMMWLTAIAPGGWLIMIGQQVDSAAYPKLAALLGQAGGLVTIPDMRDRFPAGSGPTLALNTTGGAASVALTDRQSGVRAHNHGGATGPPRPLSGSRSLADRWRRLFRAVSRGRSGLVYYNGAGEGRPGSTQTGGTDPADHLHPIGTEAAQNALDAHENRPPFRALNFIIRAG